MRGWNTQFSLLLEEERVDHKCRRLSKIIEEEARRTMPFYRLVEERLGLRGL